MREDGCRRLHGQEEEQGRESEERAAAGSRPSEVHVQWSFFDRSHTQGLLVQVEAK